MEDKNIGEDLNEKKLENGNITEEQLQKLELESKFYKQELETKLKIKDSKNIKSMQKHKSFPIGMKLSAENVLVVEFENEKGIKTAEVYSIEAEEEQDGKKIEEYQKLAIIKPDSEIELDEVYLEKFKDYIGEKDNKNLPQTANQKDLYDFEKKYYLKENPEDLIALDETEKRTEEKEVDNLRLTIATDQSVEKENIRSITKFNRPEVIGKALEKNIHNNENVFLIGLTDNTYKLISVNPSTNAVVVIAENHEVKEDAINISKGLMIKNGYSTIENNQLEVGGTGERTKNNILVIAPSKQSNQEIIIERMPNKVDRVFYGNRSESGEFDEIQDMPRTELLPEKINVNKQEQVLVNDENLSLIEVDFKRQVALDRIMELERELARVDHEIDIYDKNIALENRPDDQPIIRPIEYDTEGNEKTPEDDVQPLLEKTKDQMTLEEQKMASYRESIKSELEINFKSYELTKTTTEITSSLQKESTTTRESGSERTIHSDHDRTRDYYV